MGITITVGGVAGIPLLALSDPIISKIGHANVLFIGFVFYAIRLCGECLACHSANDSSSDAQFTLPRCNVRNTYTRRARFEA